MPLLSVMNRSLSKFETQFLKDYCAFHPTTATSLGFAEHNGSFSDFSEASVRAYLGRLSELKKDIQGLKPSRYEDPQDAIDQDLFLRKIELEKKELTVFRPHRNDPSTYVSEVLYGLWFLQVRPYSRDEKIEGLLSRLLQVRDLFAQAKLLLRRPPSVWLKIARAEAEGLFHFLNSSRRQEEGLPSWAKGVFQKAYEAALDATDDFQKFLRLKLSKEAKGRFAVGPKNFEFLLKTYHGFTEGAAVILKRGEEVFAQTQEELQDVAGRIRKGVRWEALIDEIKGDHPSQKNLIATYQSAVKKTIRFLKGRGLVSIPAGERLRVIPTPEFARSTIPYAAYIDPPLFARDRTGHFFVTPVSGDPAKAGQYLKEHSYASLLITSLHEGYPGHHLQFVYQANLKRPIRKLFNCSSYYEGWALYCEEMMGEAGFYNQKARLLQLKDKLWRACRVIVDVKMHTKGMSDNEAVDFLTKNARMAKASARADVNWYTQRPTVPLSYLTGMLKIKGLRDEVARAWRPRFSLKNFHNRLLGFGAIPISTLRPTLLLK